MEQLGFYQCSKCGNLVQVLHAEKPPVMCCGQAMELLVENTVDAALEKHVPVVEQSGDTCVVKVGSVEHPMTEEHLIACIEITTADGTFLQRKYLTPADKPQAEFKTSEANVAARAYCNLHGLWKA